MARLSRQRKLTVVTKRALQGAEEEARRLQHGYIGTEHLLLGLLRREDGVTAQLLTGLGVELGKVRSAVELVIGRGEQPATGTMHPTPRTKKVLTLAAEEAQRLGRDAVDTPHLLLGLVREGQGVAAGVLESLGATLDTLREAVEALPEDVEGEQHREEQEDDSGVSGSPWWEQADGSTAPGGRFDLLTARVKKVLVLAEEEARRLNHNHIGTEHLLLGLVREGKGTGSVVLADLGVDLGKARSTVESVVHRGERPAAGGVQLNPQATQTIELAVEEARRLRHGYVGTEHLLLGLVREGKARQQAYWSGLDVSAEQVSSAVQQRLLLEASAEPARLRTRVEQSLRKFFSGPRDNVLSIRVDNNDVAAIDALVEAGC